MRILADENIELEIINALRNAGFEVISVRETSIGAADDEILQIAVAEHAVILTHDADFGELVFRFGLRSNGVVLLRLFGLPLSVKTAKTIAVLRNHGDELENAFVVVSANSVRVRKSTS